jgi:cytochrome c
LLGFEHVKTLGKAKTVGPKITCVTCHTPERSGNFARDEKIYQEKIIHWPEPNAIDDVNKVGSGK